MVIAKKHCPPSPDQDKMRQRVFISKIQSNSEQESPSESDRARQQAIESQRVSQRNLPQTFDQSLAFSGSLWISLARFPAISGSL